MQLIFRGKVPYIISARCILANDLIIDNNFITCNTAKLEINKGQWTSSEDIKTVVEWLDNKELFLNGFEKINSPGKQIKVTYRDKHLFGEFYCSAIDIIRNNQGEFKILARDCKFNDSATKKETEQICKSTTYTDKCITDINIENIPHLHFSEIASAVILNLNNDSSKSDIITKEDVLYDDLKISLDIITRNIIFRGYWKNTRTKYDREGFLIEYGTFISYIASIEFETIQQLKEYICKIKNSFDSNIKFKEFSYVVGFHAESEIIGTKGMRIIELNSILQTNFRKSVDNNYDSY